MSAPYAPTPVPEGWTAVWDPNTQRFYYVEMATGRTQWEVPTAPSYSSSPQAPAGEAASYTGGGTSAYPGQPTTTAGGTADDRGLGSMAASFLGGGHHQQGHSGGFPMGAAGGALAGALAGFAAGKLLGNHGHGHHHQHHGGHQQGYYPPPPPLPFGGFGSFGGSGHHHHSHHHGGHHGHHGFFGGHHHGW